MVPGTFDQCMMQAWAKDPSSKHSFLGIIRKTHRSHPSSVVNYTVNKFPIRSFQLGCRLALAYFSPTPSCLLLVVKVDCERTRGKGPLRHSWHFTEFLVDLRFSCRILHRLDVFMPMTQWDSVQVSTCFGMNLNRCGRFHFGSGSFPHLQGVRSSSLAILQCLDLSHFVHKIN